MFNTAKTSIGVFSAVAALVLTSCAGDSAAESGGTDELSVYATTGYLADAVENIAPAAEVTTMVGPGGDPHTYQPSTQDIETIESSDVVLWNGLHLEAQMIDLLEAQGDRQSAVADELPEDLLLSWPETDDEGNALHDPHVWNSPEAWTIVVDHVADKLGEPDPDNAEEYAANAENYQQQIAETADEVDELLADVPEPRMLITGHDAFDYFGETYDLEVHATDYVSTEAALSAGELSELADLIADNEVPVIFQDNQANPQAITSLKEAVEQRGWEVEVSDAELYADSLGSEEGVETYLGVFEHNANAIADALGEE